MMSSSSFIPLSSMPIATFTPCVSEGEKIDTGALHPARSENHSDIFPVVLFIQMVKKFEIFLNDELLVIEYHRSGKLLQAGWKSFVEICVPVAMVNGPAPVAQMPDCAEHGVDLRVDSRHKRPVEKDIFQVVIGHTALDEGKPASVAVAVSHTGHEELLPISHYLGFGMPVFQGVVLSDFPNLIPRKIHRSVPYHALLTVIC